MAGIDVLRRFLVALGCHLGRIRRTRHAALPELVSLNVVFRAGGFNAVRFTGLGHRSLLKYVLLGVSHQIPSAFSPASRPGTLTWTSCPSRSASEAAATADSKAASLVEYLFLTSPSCSTPHSSCTGTIVY